MNVHTQNNIFVNKKHWQSGIDVNQFIDNVFNYYRETGFPYYSTSQETRQKEFKKLMSYNFSKIIKNKVVGQTMHGLALAWSYMPHSWSVKCNGKLTPLDVFYDDEKFKKAIVKRMSMGDNISDAGIRKILKMYSGAQSVSNFRPTAAAAIYRNFVDEGATVLDMSCGYGGRLLGAIRANVNYIGFDPCLKTFNGLKEIVSDFAPKNLSISIYNQGSERMELRNAADFAFTSPPYFNTEVYSDEPTQSCNMFTTKQEWINGFLKPVFLRTNRALKNDAIMAINIANVPSFKNLTDETIKTALQSGFVLLDEYKLSLSNSNFKSNSPYKYEPIYIFKKVLG